MAYTHPNLMLQLAKAQNSDDIRRADEWNRARRTRRSTRPRRRLSSRGSSALPLRTWWRRMAGPRPTAGAAAR